MMLKRIFNFQSVTLAIFACVMSTNTLSVQLTQVEPAQAAERATVPVPIEQVVTLTPANSRISFVGIHVGAEPKPRLGGFSEFYGQVKVDAATNTIISMAMDIKVDSVWTEFADLTTHLQNADFLDVPNFPGARFVSTEIQMGEDGNCTVTGDLTLHGQTQPISFPANYRFENAGLVFASQFSLDRSEFGMGEMLSGVEKAVALEFFIGQETTVPEAQEGHGGDDEKQQSSVEMPSERQQVSLKLPNMTWSGCEASVRSDLSSVNGLTEIETNLDDKTCSFEIDATTNVDELINGLATKNNKMAEWSRDE